MDAVLIATPGNHASLATAALMAGLHVLAEKPLALTVADAEAVGALARDRGLVLQVGAMKMYDALVPTARVAVQEMADVRLVEVSVRHPSDAPQTSHLRTPPAPALTGEAALTARAADAADEERVTAAVGDLPPAWRRFYRSCCAGQCCTS